MPLTNLQSRVLKVIASHRDPESYIAGGAPLNRDSGRFSADIDVFHDREERLADTAQSDAQLLKHAGFQVAWLRQLPLVYSAEVRSGEDFTRLEWVVDSDFRFFPTVPDETFGYVLHPVDLAANKVMAAAGRREVRDLVDLITIDETILPLGPIVWAAVEKSPGFTPEGLIAEIRRNSLYPAAEWRAVSASQPVDPAATTSRLRSLLAAAEAFVASMPTEKLGLLFLKDGRVVQPDPARLQDYQTHSGQRRGQWPSSPEITAAMLEHYRRSSDSPE